MAVTLPGTGLPVATDFINPDHHQLMKMEFGAAGTATPVSAANPLPVVFATAPTTPVTGTFWQATQPVSFTWAGLTDTQLRATALPVSGTFFQATQPVSIAASVAVTGPLTDTQLRAAVVPVSLASTTVTGSVAVTGPVTDTQLRASAVPVSLASTTVTGSVSVTNAGTFAAQATLAAETTKVIGTVNNAAGANIIGKVGIDQTTPGTTNGVQINALSYPQSTGNNSTAQLAAGATFTGTIETVLSLQAAQIEVVCDQPYTVNIDQFIDAAGLKLSSTYTFTRLAGVPTNENVTLPGNYMRVRVTNNGAATTTTLQLDTTFGIMNTQPNTLSQFGNLRVVAQENGVVSTSNSTTANLAAAGVYTGTAEDVSEFSTLFVSIFSSHASATDGLSVQFSADGTNWDFTDVFTIPAATGKVFSFGVQARYYRLQYTNGATLTTSLRIQSLLSRTVKKSSSQRPSDGRGNDNDFEETLSYLTGFNGTTWDRLRSTIANGLQVDVTRAAPDVTASGSLAGAAQVVTLPLTGQSAAAAQITGTWVGTITFEASLDGTTWNPINAVSASTSTPQTTTTVNGLYRITPAGLQQIRANMSAFTSGSASVLLRGSAGTGGTFANQILPTKNTDGVSSQSVKAASTAAAFTDQAAVVDIRPGGVLAGMGASTTTGDTGAKTASGNGATQTNTGNKGIQVVIALGAVTGTVPTCVFKLQVSVDAGTTWVDIPGAATGSLTATGNFGISVYPGQAVTAGTTTTNTTATASGAMSRTWRVVWTIGGTTPSFTITSITYNYLPN